MAVKAFESAQVLDGFSWAEYPFFIAFQKISIGRIRGEFGTFSFFSITASMTGSNAFFDSFSLRVGPTLPCNSAPVSPLSLLSHIA